MDLPVAAGRSPSGRAANKKGGFPEASALYQLLGLFDPLFSDPDLAHPRMGERRVDGRVAILGSVANDASGSAAHGKMVEADLD